VRKSVYLHAGYIHASATPSLVTTVLGSCVAVCLWSPKLKLGGVNHYLLPHPARAEPRNIRFGSVAIPTLIERLAALGASPSNLEAKIFGGACLLQAFRSSMDLGSRNVELARTLLSKAGIPIVAEDVGGQRGRKLLFHTDDGTVFVREL
jgi:chemotaxis protein CheD